MSKRLGKRLGRRDSSSASEQSEALQSADLTCPQGASGGALAGIRVIDLSRVLGGPYCTQILSDHGADVIKIEPPQGDETRAWGPPFEHDLSAYFAGANRNKKCLALDLTREEARSVLFRLLETADVLVENFKPGTLEKWGLGFDDVLAPRYPKLIHCRVTGFGGVGPLGAMPGYDAAAQAWTGMMSINGSPESGPMRIGLPIVDLAAGMNACIGTLLALAERNRTGQGQSVATSLFETGMALLHPHASNWFMSGQAPGLAGSAHSNIAPYDLYRTHTCAIFLAVGNDAQFTRLCERLNRPDLPKDPRFLQNKNRLQNRDALKSELEKALSTEDGESLAEELLCIGVPAGAALTIPQAFAHPQAEALSMRQECDGLSHIAPPVRMSRTPPSIRHAAQRFAENTDEILQEAGFSAAEIKTLEASGALVRKIRKG